MTNIKITSYALLLVFLLLLSSTCISQIFRAGLVDSSMIYKKFEPPIVLTLNTPDSSIEQGIDVTGDGINDINIILKYPTHRTGFEISSSITVKEICSRFNRNIVNQFSFGDTLRCKNYTPAPSSSGDYLWFSTGYFSQLIYYGGAAGPSLGFYGDTLFTNKYIFFRLAEGNNFKHGWLNVSHNFSYRYLSGTLQDTIFSYAIEKKAITNIKTDFSISDRIFISPNPVSDKCFIEIDSDILKNEIAIYDIHGKLIMQKQVYENHYQLDFSNYKQGIYLIKIKNDKGVGIKKVIKIE
jgi:Secretion system C-terminal sorting domain